MASIINTNIPSLNAQRNLSRSQGDLDLAIQRLSSGLRINSAKDDAAGLAIASRQTVQINGLAQASRNANDGISISQTAEGAMDEITRALTRANDLAVQAASYNTSGDRESLNNEVQELISEISRIVTQTRYNGEAILDGGFNANIQVGVNVNETININVGDLAATGLGVATNYADVTGYSDAALADVFAEAFDSAIAANDTIAGSKGVGTFTANIAAQSSSQEKIDAINALSGDTGISALSYGNSAVATAAGGAGTLAAGDIAINGVEVGAGAGATTAATVAAINAVTNETGVTAVETASAAGGGDRIVLFNRTGEAINVNVKTANGATVTGFAVGTGASVGAGENGAIVLSDDLGSASVSFSADTVGEAIIGIDAATTDTLTDASVQQASIDTADNANLALLAFSGAIDQVNAERSELGAKLNRLEGTIRNLDNVRENITAARSRIQDADFAEETARLARAQVLTQAGTAMVAQANAQPQNVLALLQ